MISSGIHIHTAFHQLKIHANWIIRKNYQYTLKNPFNIKNGGEILWHPTNLQLATAKTREVEKPCSKTINQTVANPKQENNCHERKVLRNHD